MRLMHSRAAVLLAAAAFACSGCKCSEASGAATGDPSIQAQQEQSASSGGGDEKPQGVNLDAPPTDGARLAAKGLYVMIRSKPEEGGAKIGYIRLGGIVKRSEESFGKRGCPGGWYKVEPRGYACLDKDGTLDSDDPIVRAASRRPALAKPLPYNYGFVRAVLPLYLKVPTKQEQLASEFKLEEHLAWWESEGHKFNKDVKFGSNDVFIDRMGEPHDDKRVQRISTEMTEGELFGATSDDDPIPWWLDGGRKIANVAAFKVPEFAVFADRARRKTGLAFVGSLSAGPEALNRSFAITEDLRLAPTTKVKPDAGSPFHGVALNDELTLPMAFVKEQDARRYQIDGVKVRSFKKPAEYRSVVKLTGSKKLIDKRMYYELSDGKWMRGVSLGIAAKPDTMPKLSNPDERWIDVSINQQAMVLWEGQTPVYATLVSTGQDMLGDPKTTKSTPVGSYRIQSKHVTTDMDSTEGLSRDSGDPEYGKTKRRGHGMFLLAHVPWVMYFKGSYALHGAYWHDVFGTARSHGCINLSPIDAHRVFFWSTPNAPQGWHGVYSSDAEPGTLLYIHE